MFLSFYHLSNDDLEEIHKLAVLIKTNEVKLWLTEQVNDEFLRNREVKIQDAIKKLSDHKVKGPFPQFCKDYDEYRELKQLQTEYSKIHSKLLQQIRKDAVKRNFKADEKIQELFDAAHFINTDPQILNRAQTRLAVGNPPGKNGSLGDAINWQTLLQEVPIFDDLYIIADDKDFYSVLDTDLPKDFLIAEWGQEKKSDIHFYRRLSLFFKEHYPNIKLAAELEKNMDIKSLARCSSFSMTHTVIAYLKAYEDFSQKQVNLLTKIALENEQITWIINDPDAHTFYTGLIDKYEKDIDEDLLVKLKDLLD